jgi:hypothetical protein
MVPGRPPNPPTHAGFFVRIPAGTFPAQRHELKVFMLNNKINFFTTLSDQFRMSSNWRDAKATRQSNRNELTPTGFSSRAGLETLSLPGG